jgi:hypothetical protein
MSMMAWDIVPAKNSMGFITIKPKETSGENF